MVLALMENQQERSSGATMSDLCKIPCEEKKWVTLNEFR